ncbi:MAG: class I SAM-dependent methyltransferase [Gammaproteobacteria bacterium]|nr:class I SAM-dependent methyltransferase [Gammaproteobacteria bacterium]
MNRFKSAAKYYSRYRPGYPEQLFEMLLEGCGLDGSGRLLDIGCGTGLLTIPLSKYFEQAIGIDLSKEMLEEGAIAANREGCDKVEWMEGNAETLGDQFGKFKMITAGGSMHWMNTEVMLPWIYDHLIDGGYVVLIGERGGFWLGQEQWCKELARIIEKYTGKIFSECKKPLLLWQDMLASYPYRSIKSKLIDIKRAWNTEDIIGFLLSTSFCSEEVLDDRCEEFKQEVRDGLLKVSAKGEFYELNKLSIVIACKSESEKC